MEEKPLIPKSNRALVGLYRIKESTQLFETLTRIIEQKQKTQGEFHLTDAIMEMINDGVRFTDFKVDNWYDCGKKDILLETNAVMLKKNGMATEVSLSSENSIIVPPVHIPASCKVTNSIIGPNVTLGEHSEIDHAIITESIIGNYSKLNEVVLKRSVVGSDSIIHGTGKSLNLGDNAEIEVL